jgi:hypothetical protein
MADNPAITENVPAELKPWQLSLREVLLIMLLAGLVAAVFATSDMLVAALAVVAAISVWLCFRRTRAAFAVLRLRGAQERGKFAQAAFLGIVMLVLALLLSEAAAMFVILCFTFPFAWRTQLSAQEQAHIRLGEFLAMALGSSVAMVLFWLTWPRRRMTLITKCA